MKIKRKALYLLLFLSLLSFGLTSCKKNNANSGQEIEKKDSENEIAPIRVGSMRGPTAMGLLPLMEKEESFLSFEIFGSADELVPKVLDGSVDVAMVPANMSSILYNKTNKEISIFAINTWGALYVLDRTGTIESISDLDGKTVYMVGEGTTPEYVFSYILSHYPESDVKMSFRSEATELAALLATKDIGVAILPEPFVSAVLAQNEDVEVALSLVEEWNAVSDFSMVTGVAIVRNDFLEDAKNVEALQAFNLLYEESVNEFISDIENSAFLCEKYAIVPSADIAKTAIPRSSITYVTGEDMKKHVANYLKVLADKDMASIGNGLPEDDFYYDITQ